MICITVLFFAVIVKCFDNNICMNLELINVDSEIICRFVVGVEGGFGMCLGRRAGAGLLFFVSVEEVFLP